MQLFGREMNSYDILLFPMKVAGGHTPSYWLQTKIPSFQPLVTALLRCLPYLSTQGVVGGYNDHPSNEPDIHK